MNAKTDLANYKIDKQASLQCPHNSLLFTLLWVTKVVYVTLFFFEISMSTMIPFV